MRLPDVEWTLFLPHTAEVAAHGGGTWCLAVEPREGLEGFFWHVAHSGSGRGSRAGTASSVNFAKFQAELAVAELEAEAPPAPEPAKAKRGLVRTAYDVLVMFFR